MKRLARLLGSRALTPYVLLGYVVFLSFLAGWGARIPSGVVENISRLVPFWLAYIFAGLNLLFCMLLFLPAVVQRSSLEPPADDPGAPLAGLSEGDVARLARRGRFAVRWLEPRRRAVLHRNRLSPAGTLLFHGALLLLPVAFLLSRATRFSGEAWVVEGHPFGGTLAEYAKIEPEQGGEARLPEIAFRVEGVEAEFWGDRLFFTDLRALVVMDEGVARDATWMTLTSPLWSGGTRVSLRGFNYTPAFELRAAGRGLVDSGDLNLKLFPPGIEDSFRLPGLPHQFFVRLYPDAERTQSGAKSRGFALGSPLLHVAVTRGKELVGRAWLRPGEPLAFDGYELTLPHVRRGGEILVHRDWGYPVIWLAFALGLAGLAARVVFPSVRIWLLFGPDGTRVVVREDDFAAGATRRLLEQTRAG